MSKRPWMPFYPNDFRLDTLGLDDAETGTYMVLICLAWRRGDGSITGDMGELKRVLKQCFANYHGHSFNRVVPKLLERYFERGDNGRWYQPRVVKELQIADKLSANQTQKVNKRWSEYRKNKALADAAVIPSQSHKKENSPSKKMESTNGKGLPKEARPTEEAELFRRGKEVLGQSAGGMIAKLFKAKKRNVPECRAAIELAAGKGNPREYVGAIIAGGIPSMNGQARQLTEDEQWVQNNIDYYGTTDPDQWGIV
jgi:uncharacterized protein YdaU (DUF1376 family)